jgi:hypothetical protein
MKSIMSYLDLCLTSAVPRFKLSPEVLSTEITHLSVRNTGQLEAMFMHDSVIVEVMGIHMPIDLLFLPILLHPCPL